MLSGLSTSVGENNGADDRYLGECSCCWHKDLYAVKDSVLSRDVCSGGSGQVRTEGEGSGQLRTEGRGQVGQRGREVDRCGRGRWTGVTEGEENGQVRTCLLYTSPSPRDQLSSRMPSSA